MLGEDGVIERHLLDEKEPRPLQHLRQEPRPGIPVRGVVMQRKHPAIDHRVAAQTIGGTPAESFAIILPSQCPTKGLWPLVMAFVGAVDLRGDRKLVMPGCSDVAVDYA